jgi:hypothetical protein
MNRYSKQELIDGLQSPERIWYYRYWNSSWTLDRDVVRVAVAKYSDVFFHCKMQFKRDPLIIMNYLGLEYELG